MSRLATGTIERTFYGGAFHLRWLVVVCLSRTKYSIKTRKHVFVTYKPGPIQTVAMFRLEQTYSLCLCYITLVREIAEKSAIMISFLRRIFKPYCAMVADSPLNIEEKFPLCTPTSRIGARSLLPVNSRFMGGLNNLGNTCYLNAAIQCLLSVPPFVEYFISGRYEKHINEENKLGTGGLLAKSFAKLIREMASTNWCYKIHVGEFKRIVSKHQSRFRGYDQNDAEEFLSYLLDALHEDLNRIIEKPYKEIDDDFKKSDERRRGGLKEDENGERAVEIWAIHKSRNDSIIVDLFHFLLKSTVECSRCGEKSITFDPTAILSVPINVKEIMWITVVFIPLLPEKKMVKRSMQLVSTVVIQHTESLESTQKIILYQVAPACNK
uniref:ubiquitinyl hydrolase 1 n=1 Tax=Romanomermis culicivorax TaxID=13658 RepID=A0A915J7T6_ROMCU